MSNMLMVKFFNDVPQFLYITGGSGHPFLQLL